MNDLLVSIVFLYQRVKAERDASLRTLDASEGSSDYDAGRVDAFAEVLRMIELSAVQS